MVDDCLEIGNETIFANIKYPPIFQLPQEGDKCHS
jgi:hypothetical protein